MQEQKPPRSVPPFANIDISAVSSLYKVASSDGQSRKVTKGHANSQSMFAFAALAIAAQASVPDAVQECFIEHGDDWANHRPLTVEVCLAHCTVMCGACSEIVVENAGGLFGPMMPEPSKGWAAFMSCLCQDPSSLANTIGPDGKQDTAKLGGILMACAAPEGAHRVTARLLAPSTHRAK